VVHTEDVLLDEGLVVIMMVIVPVVRVRIMFERLCVQLTMCVHISHCMIV
jgi:hypothetical protein